MVAVGPNLGGTRQQFLYGLGGDRPQRSNIVTLELMPQQALALIQATAGGENQLTLLLRPPLRGASGSGAGSLLKGG